MHVKKTILKVQEQQKVNYKHEAFAYPMGGLEYHFFSFATIFAAVDKR